LQAVDGDRRDWSGHGGVTKPNRHVSMNAVQAGAAVGLEKIQRGHLRKTGDRINLNPYATKRSDGKWYATRGVPAPNTELKRQALKLLLGGHLKTATPTPEEVETAQAIRDASLRPTVDTSPEVEAVQPAAESYATQTAEA